MKRMQLQAAEAQFDENKSDPDLDLCQPQRLLEGEDILVSVWRVHLAGIDDRHASVVLIVSSV